MKIIKYAEPGVEEEPEDPNNLSGATAYVINQNNSNAIVEPGDPDVEPGDPDVEPGDPNVEPGDPNAPGAPRAPSGRSSSTASIKSMQQKMQEFAKIIVPTASSTYGRGSKETGGRMVGSEAGLGYFLANQYSGAGKYQQFENPEATKIKEKGKLQSTDDYTSIRNSIENIGGSRSEKTPDGVWGPKTQNGIRNILNLSGSLIEFADRIEFTINKDFDSAQKDKLASLIPEEDNPSARKSFKELNERAEQICPILDKLNSFSKALHEHIISQYKEYEQGEAFAPGEIPSSETKEIELDQFDQSYLNKIHPFNINYQQQTFENITLNDLKSYESLKKKITNQLDQKGVSVDEWMAKNYSNFIAAAEPQIIEELEARGQILDESAVTEINEIKENIMSCLELAHKISSNFDRSSYIQYIQNQFIDPIKKSPVYRSAEKRKELLDKSALTKQKIAEKVKEQYRVEK